MWSCVADTGTRVGDEPRLLGNGHWWAPRAHNFVLLIIVLVDWPVVLVVDLGLMHELKEVSEPVLGSLKIWIVLWQV